jgi:hypothetical protein
MVCTPINSFSAPEGKYPEPSTSLHPIKAKGYEIHPDFISLVREFNFVGGLCNTTRVTIAATIALQCCYSRN